jgi:CheY-like chemotaxis protein
MAKTGQIVIVEDDIDDQEIFEDVMKELKVQNERVYFTLASNALEHLQHGTVQPFIIFCDINLPGLSGLDFKRQIDSDNELRRKSIPFIFISTSTERAAVTIAYTEMVVQGFFKKPDSINEMKNLLEMILNYWQRCTHPNA